MDKLVIFDFDGVLSDSFDALYEVNRRAAETLGRELTREQYRQCFAGSLHSELARVLGLTDDEAERFIAYKVGIINDIYNPSTVRLYPGSRELVQGLHKVADLFIASSAPEPVIRVMLERHDLADCFREISGINREGKKKTIERFLSRKSGATAYFITDTTGDILEAKAAGMDTVAVAWGFHGREALAAASPDFLAETATEVVEYII